ncbi:hypothetical protein I4641_14420 [Waterburya agarophytonicola K14]|uniref:THUMP domain-containing protein n=1 Tax=Waterburya agarophytonicola KI4 TaxID=2874699 RepID=A0A964BRC1_9CYAN|nr:hypothetical protein [Waterburya agarophytonicola]MCC0178174.1 hypothetical protein [Waterburya agarophytonicola KI4]
MLYWNVLIKVQKHNFSPAYLLLEKLGRVYQSDFEDLLLVKVESIPQFLAECDRAFKKDAHLLNLFERIVPVTKTFDFQSQEEFETQAKEIVMDWIPMLADKKFYVRMHRIGFKDRIDRHEEETFLDLVILQELENIGKPGQIGGVDPDMIVAVETVTERAGLACWTRQDLQAYPWLGSGLLVPQ